LFDPSTRTFSVTGAFPTGRYNHAATLLQDGSVLVTGGAYAFGVEDDAYLFVSPSP
jgi:hypothetical protein